MHSGLAFLAGRDAHVNLVALPERQRRRGHGRFEGGFLRRVFAFYVANVQHAPVFEDRHDRVL